MKAFKKRDLDFDSMSEDDVRANVLDPLLEALGYLPGTPHHVMRGVALRDQNVQTGRQKKGRGRPVGAADYLLHVWNARAWVMEAKPPSDKISAGMTQTRSYATHQEINVSTFVISNGRFTSVFRTGHGSKQDPILTIAYAEMEEKFGALLNLLAPSAIEDANPKLPYDFGEPLGPGLRARETVTDGVQRVESWHPESLGDDIRNSMPSFRRGTLRRVGSQIQLVVAPWTGLEGFEKLRAKKGREEITFLTNDQQISANVSSPTLFKAARFPVHLAEGELVPRRDGSYDKIESPRSIDVELTMSLVVRDRRLEGSARCILCVHDAHGAGPISTIESTCELELQTP